MSDRPTPRTDAAVFISRGMGIVPTLPKEAVRADFARQLERELAEARQWPAILSGWGGTPEIVHGFIKGQQARIHAAQDVEKEHDRLAECLAILDIRIAEAREENLEQARLLGMSGEREADLRGELEREKRRADGLRYELAATREQRDEALDLLRRIARKSAFMDREGLRLVVSDWLARRHLSENATVEARREVPPNPSDG